jgi:hypothetical protein
MLQPSAGLYHRGRTRRATMIRLLLLGSAASVLTPGAASAHIPSISDSVATTSRMVSAVVSDNEAASHAELHWIGRSFGENVVILLRDVTLLGVGTLLVGVGAVCINARRPLDTKAPPHADHAAV